MKLTSMLLTMAGALTLSGCSSLLSLNPFVTDDQAATDTTLIGTWTDSQDGSVYVIRQDGKAYAITYTDGSSPASKFEARLLKAGDAELLDLVSANDDPFQIPAHLIVRVWSDGLTMRWAFLDSDWLKQLAAQQLAVQASGDRTLITAPGEAVRQFLLKWGPDDRAYDKSTVLRKSVL
ncbi:MAG TPA: hypothetical protein VLY04_09605 [Bryobacteraceae bacterium]|nr:hypothetical protein [Bryobacteraceae bacterium]